MQRFWVDVLFAEVDINSDTTPPYATLCVGSDALVAVDIYRTLTDSNQDIIARGGYIRMRFTDGEHINGDMGVVIAQRSKEVRW